MRRTKCIAMSISRLIPLVCFILQVVAKLATGNPKMPQRGQSELRTRSVLKSFDQCLLTAFLFKTKNDNYF